MSKQISASEFTKLVNEGKTKLELSEYYDLSPANIAQVAEQLNLKFKKKVLPKFQIVYDLDANVTVNENNIQATVFTGESQDTGEVVALFTSSTVENKTLEPIQVVEEVW